MTEEFQFDVTIDNGIKVFDAEFRKLGYGYKIAVWINDNEIIYEPDEERSFRAVSINQSFAENRKFMELVKLVGERLNELFER